jgi:hypothetical protein
MAASRANDSTLRIDVKPFGPTAEELAAIGQRILRDPEVLKRLGRKHRLLTVEALEPAADKPGRPRPPDRFRATLYDYEASHALVAEGRLPHPSELELTESAEQPPVTSEEFAEAVQLIERDAAFGAELRGGRLAVYPPMPPLLDVQEADGSTRRVIAVGLFDAEARRAVEILGVDLADARLHRFDERAPVGTRPPNATMCGVPPAANQPTAAKGTAGQVWITVKQGGKTLWRFLAVRPAASSGLRGSGVELRYVDFRGKRVLYRAHVPILNVKYGGDACGPYRDWQYQEGQIQATGTNVAPGFRLCPTPARTIMDTGSDTGNFLGVGIYVERVEVVLVSEMEAGWYRYVSEWRLRADGRIRPRFGFAATQSACVCNVHHHHAYWRLDFDVISAGGNRILEFNDPPLFAGRNWHEKRFEIARPRDPARHRKWRVQHTSGSAYDINPRPEDGVATQAPDWPFGRGDLWFLRYRGSELDDGVNHTSGAGCEAQIGKWVNGEDIFDRDVVVWYGGHFTHDVSHDDPAQHGHVVGPDLVPVNWPA